MAAEVNARQNRQPALAFTLPISCQVCLGKVKAPVLCPNNHVFCSSCLDVWLQKTKQCPACRVPMSSYKKILGGLSQHEESDTDKLTNPDLRKARFDLLYKEYENEFERMHSELQLLRTENQILKQQAKRDGSNDGRSGESSRASDGQNLLLLTKKLQDATKLYEKVKGELRSLKQENSNLKDENVSLNRENQSIRQELAGRSPHRYGRTTVATLESKLASAEKDITRLTKAMERSDKYIEELESELDGYRGTNSGATGKRDKYLLNGDADRKVMSDSKVSQYGDYRSGKDSLSGRDNASRRQLFNEDKESRSASTGERSKYYYDRNGDDRGARNHREGYSEYSDDISSGKTTQSAKNDVPSNGKKRVTFDLDKNTNATMSFDLELPSPLKSSGNRNGVSNGRASPVKGVLKKPGSKGPLDDKSIDSYTDLSRTADDSDIYLSKSSSRQSKDDDMLYTKSRSRSVERDYKSDNLYSKPKKKYSADDSFLSEPSSMEVKSLREFDYGSKRAGDRKNDMYDRKESDYNKRRDLSKSYDSDLTRDELEDTQCIESELDELNISLTPEFTDCMKLLNRAEKKVHTHDTSDEDDAVPHYRSSQDTETDKAFRASTGSIGYKSGAGDDLRASTGSFDYKSATRSGEDFLTAYKSEQGNNRFTSSLDSYSRGRHVRSGSLDNLFIDRSAASREERPSSALPTSSNMYSSSASSKYTTGLTTGRTTLTRTPSLDNLLMSRPSTVEYLPGQNLNRYSVGRSYRGENDKLDVNANINTVASSTGGSWQKPVTAVHGILGDVDSGLERPQDNRAVTFDSVLQARARSMSDMGQGNSEFDRMASSSGRVTPTLTGSTSTSGGRVTPTIPTHSEYMASSKPAYPFTASGRSTPTLTSTNTNFDTYTKSNLQYSDYKTSSTDMALKPPTGLKQSEFNPSMPSYLTSTSHSAPSSQYSSLPVYSSTIGSAQYDSKVDSGPMSAPYTGSRYSESATKNDFNYDDFSIGARPNSITSSNNQPVYTSNDKYNSQSSYNSHNFMDNDFSTYSSKAPSGGNGVPVSSGTNSSALFTGSSSSSSSMYGYPSSNAGSSYLPSTFVPSYTSALSVPLTHTTSSYTSSAPSASYPSKPLDPIAESSNHYSYVSNASGDYSSKNDTFALPEPKKRLFEDSEDLNLSVSPIKSNRRF